MGNRRAVIQQVKREVLDDLWRLRAGGAELRSELPAAIERAFADLPVQDMPHGELLAIATSIRNKLHRNADAAQKRAAQLLATRQALIRDGHSYAVAQLKDVEGLKVFERWRIQNRIDESLKRLAGDETLEDVHDLIEDVLETEGIDWSDEDD